MTVWPTGRLRIPPGLDQAQKCLDSAWQRRCDSAVAVAAIVFPLGDQRVTMRRQRRVELRRVQVRESDLPTGELLARGLGDRRLRLWPRLGFGPRFQLHRGTQLVDRGAACEL